MTEGLKTIIVPVRDLAKAKAVYGQLLGVQPSSDEPYYVGFELDGQQLGLDPNGHAHGMTGPVGYWHVDDINGSVRTLVEAGAVIQRDVVDVGGGRLIATLTDDDGNVMGLLQP